MTQPHLRGHIKLCDFGLAGEFTPATAGARTADVAPLKRYGTGFTQLLGTPEYIAPEIVHALLAKKRGGTVKPYSQQARSRRGLDRRLGPTSS